MARSSKLFKKRKFCGNQHAKRQRLSTSPEKDRPTEQPNLRPSLQIDASEPSTSSSEFTIHSTSFTKLKTDINNISIEKKQCTYVIVDLEHFANQLQNFVGLFCKSCGVRNISLSENPSKRLGCAAEIIISCDTCKSKEKFMTSTKTDKGIYDINLRLVYGFRSIGSGLEDAKMLCTIVDMPGPPTKFMKYNRIIAPIINKVANDCMVEAVQEVIEKTGSTDLAVAVDGSWQKRGFKSKNGVVTITSVETGKVLDCHVLSKYCQGCQLAQGNEERLKKHESECELNYEGNSGGMEVEGARSIFCRSLANRGVRYVTYLGDGDCKGHSAVSEAHPYGPDVDIVKAECIGHIQKRMGARLQKLCDHFKKGDKLSDGLGLKGKGRLTKPIIGKLQAYYGEAIRRNINDVKAMRQAIWAIFFHKLSTDENPSHQLCPKGADSWCPYIRAKCTNAQYTHTNSIPLAVMEYIKPVFRDLSNDSLLSRCVLGKTQNPNESFNANIWKRVPKTNFCGIVTLKLGVNDAILAYNNGAVSKINVLKALGLKCSKNIELNLQRCDIKRIKEAENRCQEVQKKKRKVQAQRNKKEEEKDIHKDYEAGMY